MASYKVAQDVEAEDKLLGPFSFRQFIYLIIAAMAGVLAYGLSQVFIGLVVIPLPVILFFIVLALPLRKDQPMEVYLAAIVSYYLKPRKRLWQPDGVQSLIVVTASQSDEQQLTKNISGSEAERRLAYLATLADTQGWSVRNVTTPQTNSSMIPDAYNDAQNVPDSFDENGGLARSFDSMIDKADTARRQAAISSMQTPPPTATAQIVTPTTQSATSSIDNNPRLSFNPYPTAMRQHVISPSGPAPQPIAPPQNTTPATPKTNPPTPSQTYSQPDSQTTSEKPLSPDIINLANNKDLSVETIAREAHRIEAKHHDDDEEVVISLR